MKTGWGSAAIAALCLFASIAFAGRVYAQQPTPDWTEAQERDLVESIRARSADAARAFEDGSRARAAGDFTRALAGFRRAKELLPDCADAWRRECSALSMLQQREAAIASCRRALELANRPENQAALAYALVSPPTGEADAQEALSLSNRSTGANPNDPIGWMAQCRASYTTRDLASMEACSERLRALAPNDPSGWLFGALRAGGLGELDEAETLIEGARARGLPEAQYTRFRALVEEARPWPVRYGRVALRWLALWLGAFAALLLAGVALSALTLRATRDPAANAEPGAGERRLRQAYGAVIAATCALFFVSVPLVMLVVVAVGGGLVLGMLAIGHIPVKLLVIVVLLTLATVWAVLKGLWYSLIARPKELDPGASLDFDSEPIGETLRAVAARVGTRPVDRVFITPGTDLAVFERGGLWARMRGRGERCLVLGVALLDGMDVQSFRAVLAHEYGHFRNDDAAGGDLALTVRRALLTIALHLAANGVAVWYNPAWWFVSGFHRVFLRVSQGASRLQEILADRRAVHAFGGDAFERGLRHVIGRSVRFDRHVSATLNEVVPAKAALANLYEHSPAKAVDEGEVETEVRQALERPASPYDSHPRPVERIERARAIHVSVEVSIDGDQPAWSLLRDRAATERAMTAEVRDRVEEQLGVRIPAEAAVGPQPESTA